jgi:hypothetical protein
MQKNFRFLDNRDKSELSLMGIIWKGVDSVKGTCHPKISEGYYVIQHKHKVMQDTGFSNFLNIHNISIYLDNSFELSRISG